MKFRTTCTHCDSVFLLSSEQLEAAQGWAQCSVCGGAFNVRSTLASENGDPLPVAPAPLIEAAPDPVTLAPPEAPPVSPEPVATETSIPTEPVASPEEAVSPLAGVEARASHPDLTSIILIDPDAEVTDDYGPMPDFSAVDAGPASTISIYGPAYSVPDTILHAAKPNVAAGMRVEPPKIGARSTSRRSQMSLLVWTIVAVLLVLILLAQLTYFLRDKIALQVPAARPWLERACAPIGCSLSLPKDAALIQIIGSDLQAQPAGAGLLQLKLTLGNRAVYAQAWPVIVLTLTDAKDQAQARRSFAPSEYLPDQKLLAAGIPGQSEHQLALPLEVRNLTLAGYRLEVAY